jgi:carboxymethylenebutenolidase
VADFIDPLLPANAAFKRRVFVGLGAGAAALASPIAAALAQGEGFGKPHPPIVAEDDPAIVVDRPPLVRPGTTIDAYAAWPKTAGPATPGLVLVQAIWGVDAQLRDTVRRYAKEGFLCIAPALFARSSPPSGDGATDIAVFRPLAAALVREQVKGDLLAGRDWIRAKAPQAKVGISGFCMGGGITIREVIGEADYHAAVPFYGDVLQGAPRDQPVTADTFAYAKKIATPLLGNYGARDTSIKAEDVRAMFGLLAAPHDLKVYDEAGHAFFDDTRPSYVASAASDAWTRTLGWLRRYLS